MRLFSARTAVLFFLLCVTSASLFAGELDQWFASDSRAPAYASIRGELDVLADGLAREGIPVVLLVDRLDEGSAKRIAPAKLLDALRKDSDDFLFLGSLYARREPAMYGDPQSKKDALVVGSLILRSGIGRDMLEQCLTESGSGGSAVKRCLDALLAVASVHRRSPLQPGQLARLTQALVVSPEKPERFSALSSLFVRGRAGGIRAGEIAELVIGAFGRGGGFVQAENEISRRIK